MRGANFKILLFALLFLAIDGGCAFAAQSYAVSAGSTATVNEWGTCRRVANASGWPSIFVPTNSAAEWDAFRTNHPSHVTLSNCAAAIPNSATVTVWARGACGYYPHTYTISSLPQTFYIDAPRYYTVSRSGANNIKIHAYHNLSWPAPGNNLVAVRLDGVPGYPSGLYASEIVSLTLGIKGIEASKWNILGHEDALGPYSFPGWGLQQYTFLGDQHSEIVVGFGL